jgi:hypothetical protein
MMVFLSLPENHPTFNGLVQRGPIKGVVTAITVGSDYHIISSVGSGLTFWRALCTVRGEEENRPTDLGFEDQRSFRLRIPLFEFLGKVMLAITTITTIGILSVVEHRRKCF